MNVPWIIIDSKQKKKKVYMLRRFSIRFPSLERLFYSERGRLEKIHVAAWWDGSGERTPGKQTYDDTPHSQRLLITKPHLRVVKFPDNIPPGLGMVSIRRSGGYSSHTADMRNRKMDEARERDTERGRGW